MPSSIVDDVKAGRAVIVNASRTIIEFVRRSYAKVTVVLVTAPPDVLAKRLAAHTRPSDGQIDDRLRRTVVAAIPDVIINNVGLAEDHAAELLSAIGRG